MSIFIPNWDSDGVTFETFRAAPRPFGNAVSYVNSAFLARTASGENLMEDICLAFGAYGIDHAIRASKVEAFLKDKPVSSFVILKAVQLLKETVSPSEGTTHPEYRISLAVSFLFTFLSSLTKSMNEPAKVNVINGSYTNGTRDTSSGYSLKEHLKVDRNICQYTQDKKWFSMMNTDQSASRSRKSGQSSKLLVYFFLQCTTLPDFLK
jgi:indole-3-acetaldehyde oxidase